MKLFGYFLALGWGLLFTTVALSFLLPNAMHRILSPIAGGFVLIPSVLLIASGLFGLLQLYRVGMKRSR